MSFFSFHTYGKVLSREPLHPVFLDAQDFQFASVFQDCLGSARFPQPVYWDLSSRFWSCSYFSFIHLWGLCEQGFDRGHVCRNSFVLIAYTFEEVYLISLILFTCTSVPDGSLRVCVCCVVRAETHTYIPTYKQTYIHTYVRTYVHTYIHNTHTHIYPRTHARMHTCMHACMHTYKKHTYIHTCTHAYRHTNKPTYINIPAGRKVRS